jgi:hypothetical protein
MSMRTDRRNFLRAGAAGAAMAGLGDLGFLSGLRPVPADEARLDPKVVRLQPEIEPLVRLLEDTPRERLLEEVAGRIKKGLSYQEVLAALLLAGVRNVQPRPHVGFKFHAVLVVNSAHLASLGSPDTDRWLPIFWALDYFKSAQAQDVKEGNWTMGPVDEKAVPPPGRAREAFRAAMDRWDEPAADAAIAGLARTAGSNEIYELFVRYGCRDFRDIGHKAIYVANSWRTLNCIGWQHAEPILRSLAYALLQHEGGNPADRDDPADRPGRHNLLLAARIREGWSAGRCDPLAAADLLSTLRTGSDDDASRQVVEILNRGVSPQTLWDALFDGAGELLLRQPGIVALHAVTTTNAMHYAYQATGDDLTRRLLLLQNAAFLTLFRGALGGRGRASDARIDRLEPSDTSSAKDCAGAIEEIFAGSGDKTAAARRALGYLQAGHEAGPLIDAARRLVFLKGDDAHDYKFSSALLEDYYHASPSFRERYLAAGMLLLPASSDRDNGLVKRIRAAMA